jgi:hypothetical protein
MTVPSRPKRARGAYASRPVEPYIALASWKMQRRSFGVRPQGRTPRPLVPRPKRDKPHGGHERHNAVHAPVRSVAQARIEESTPIGSDERVCPGEGPGGPRGSVRLTSRSKWRLAPRLESPSASRALHASLAARRTRRVNREVARPDRARPRTHNESPAPPSAGSGGIHRDHTETEAE